VQQATSRYAFSISRVLESDSTIAPTDLAMMVLVVFELQDTLERARLADALRALRMSAHDETKDLMWKSKDMGYHLVHVLGLSGIFGRGGSSLEGCRPICKATEDRIDGRCVPFNLECQSR
jgi:hypothetical protein